MMFPDSLPDLDAEHILEPTDLSLTDPLQSYCEAWEERLEYELHGAWRAGYEYVHIYTDPDPPLADGFEGVETTFTEHRYIFPAHSERPPRPDSLRYLYTYDITDVPDHVIRSAVRGELNKYDCVSLSE